MALLDQKLAIFSIYDIRSKVLKYNYKMDYTDLLDMQD